MGDPAVSIAYKCTIDGFIPLGIWTKLDGLGFEYQVTEYREGGVNGYTHKIIGPGKYTNLRLSRPVDSTSDLLMLWLQGNLIEGPAADDGDHRDDRGRRGDHDLEPRRRGAGEVERADARHHEQQRSRPRRSRSPTRRSSASAPSAACSPARCR